MDAWHETVLEHRPWLRGLIAARLDRHEPVDDVLQETIRAAIATGAPDTRNIRDVKGWLGGIARNKVRQFIDRKGRDRRLQGSIEAITHTEAALDSPSPDDLLIRSERITIAALALEQLSSDEANLLRLKYVERWPYTRISSELKMTLHEVANRLRLARRNLRRIVETLSESESTRI